MSPSEPEAPIVHLADDEPDADDDTAPDALVAHGASLLRETEPGSADEAAWMRDAATRIGRRFREALHGDFADAEVTLTQRKSRP